MKDLLIVQKCLHCVNKSECVREEERTLCEWYVDPGHVLSENLSYGLFSPAQVPDGWGLPQENITGAGNVDKKVHLIC